jgi:hypothetical protein
MAERLFRVEREQRAIRHICDALSEKIERLSQAVLDNDRFDAHQTNDVHKQRRLELIELDSLRDKVSDLTVQVATLLKHSHRPQT